MAQLVQTKLAPLRVRGALLSAFLLGIVAWKILEFLSHVDPPLKRPTLEQSALAIGCSVLAVTSTLVGTVATLPAPMRSKQQNPQRGLLISTRCPNVGLIFPQKKRKSWHSE